MPVTTRKQLRSEAQTKKNLPSAALPVVNNKSIFTTLDQRKNKSKIPVESAPIITITGVMNNIEMSDYENPFGGDSFYELYESTKFNGQYGQTIDQQPFYTDIQREENLAYLQNNQQQIALALESTCLMSPPMSECDPCSPAARSRSASATDIMVPPSPIADVFAPNSPNEQDAALDILDEIWSDQSKSQATEIVAPISSQDIVCQLDEMISTSQEVTAFDFEDVLDFINSQPDAPRDMWTQEQICLKAAVGTQESFSSQACQAVVAPAIVSVPAPEILDDATIDDILSVIESQASCVSPAHSVDSSYSAVNSASPAHSVTSDEEYLPVAELKRKNGLGGNKRGRKRKDDGDFDQEQQGNKKQKNAEAAARYRQKKKEEDKQAHEDLETATAALNKTREMYDKALKKRNLMLQMFFEQAKTTLRFPSWVEPYLKKNEI